MLKKGIHCVPITYIFFDPYINVPRREFTHNLCFNPYLNVRKENLLFQGCIRCCTDEKERQITIHHSSAVKSICVRQTEEEEKAPNGVKTSLPFH